VKAPQPQQPPRKSVPTQFRSKLIPVAERVFWWGDPATWMEDSVRFAAQVMTFGDWDDTTLTMNLLGEELLCQVLTDPPPGVFDIKSWTYWHHRCQLPVPPLPTRRL
jgi:hypothetical protein